MIIYKKIKDNTYVHFNAMLYADGLEYKGSTRRLLHSVQLKVNMEHVIFTVAYEVTKEETIRTTDN